MKNKLKKLQAANVVVTVCITTAIYADTDALAAGDIQDETFTSYEFPAVEEDWEGASYSSYLESIVKCFTDEGCKFSAVSWPATVETMQWAESPDGTYMHPYDGTHERVSVSMSMVYFPYAKHAVSITDKLRADILEGVERG